MNLKSKILSNSSLLDWTALLLIIDLIAHAMLVERPRFLQEREAKKNQSVGQFECFMSYMGDIVICAKHAETLPEWPRDQDSEEIGYSVKRLITL
jgi:hypothetical protein